MSNVYNGARLSSKSLQSLYTHEAQYAVLTVLDVYSNIDVHSSLDDDEMHFGAALLWVRWLQGWASISTWHIHFQIVHEKLQTFSIKASFKDSTQ